MVTRLIRVVPALFAVACATGRAEAPADDPMSRGLAALDSEAWSQTQVELNRVARRCESGTAGVDALLILSTVALDPSNPGRDASSAARYAAHVIRLSDVDAVRLQLAEGLYLAALDAGADVPTDDRRTAPGAALRYTGCDDPLPDTAEVRTLPVHPGTTLALALAMERARADSLAAVVDSVGAATERVVVVDGSGGGESEVARLRSRVSALEAELERIRRLLRKGGP